MDCPCGTGLPYDGCCGPLLAGLPAPSAERLMRSRYTAFARGDTAHLLASWHPATRPPVLRLEPGLVWVRLEVLARTAGGPVDPTGTVAFAAHHRQGRRMGVLREHSAFARDAGRWVYVGPVGPVPG